jgi:hypothetical protein
MACKPMPSASPAREPMTAVSSRREHKVHPEPNNFVAQVHGRSRSFWTSKTFSNGSRVLLRTQPL